MVPSTCSISCPLTKGWCGWWPGTSRRACLGPGGCTPTGFGWCPGPACYGSPQTCPGRVCHCSHSPWWWLLLHCTWQGSNAWVKWPRNQRSVIGGDVHFRARWGCTYCLCVIIRKKTFWVGWVPPLDLKALKCNSLSGFSWWDDYGEQYV